MFKLKQDSVILKSSDAAKHLLNDEVSSHKSRVENENYPYALSFFRGIKHRYNSYKYKYSPDMVVHGIPQRTFNTTVPTELAKPSNKKIRNTILNICADEKGPYIISPIIDHWTTFTNLKSMIRTQGIYGSASLEKKGLSFKDNCLAPSDKWNLDGNVICCSPGGFVDLMATEGADRIRMRIDLRKVILPGIYNTLFKIIDFGCGGQTININLTDSLSVTVEHIRQYASIIFSFKGENIKISLEKNEHIFYGDLAGINRFCLLLPFIALQKAIENNENIDLILSIYEHLNTLDKDELKKLLICLSQNITLFSEFNFNSKLPLTSKLIYDIHDVSTNTTYPLYELSNDDYDTRLASISEAPSLEFAFEHSMRVNENIKFSSPELQSKESIILYSLLIKRDNTILHIDATTMDNDLFTHGYIETRPGNRFVPKIPYLRDENEIDHHETVTASPAAEDVEVNYSLSSQIR